MSFAATLDPKWVTAGPWRQFGNWYLQPQSFSPNMLSPYAWYDAHLGGSAAGITDSSANARAAMTVGAGSNSPLWLPYVRPSALLPPSTSSITTTPGQTHDLSVQTDQSYRFRLRIDSLGTAADTFYACLITEGNGLLPYVTQAGDLLFATYDPGYHGSGSLGSIIPYLGQWVDIWYKYQHGSPATVTGYVRTDLTKSLADNTGWTTLSSSTVAPVPALNAAASYMASYAPINGGQVAINEIAGWKSATPSSSPTINWKAEGCTQASYVDTINSHTWPIVRPASGRKLVVQSPAAGSAESLFLLGVDDKFDGPIAAVPSCANAASASMFAVIRPWATQATPKVIFSTRSGSGAGITLRMASATTVVADISDGTTTNTTPAVTFTPGLRAVVGVHLSSGGTAYCSVNNTAGSTVARPSNTQAGGVLVFGADSTPGNFLDVGCRVPFLAMSSLASAGQIAQLVSYYGGGL